MEFILNTDIFDEEIDVKFNDVILANKDKFITGTPYRLTMSFHVYLLRDIRFIKFNAPKSDKASKDTLQDKIYDVVIFQSEKLHNILDKNGIEVYSTNIYGDYLESDKITKIEISEDTSEPMYSGRGKNRRRDRSRCIALHKLNAIIIIKSVLAGIDPKPLIDTINFLDKYRK